MRLGIKQKTLLVLVSVVALTAVVHALLAGYLTKRQHEQASFALIDRELHAWQDDLSDRARDLKARALVTVGDETVLGQIVEQVKLERRLREADRPADVADLTRTLGNVKSLSLSRLQIALRTGGFSSIAVRTRGALSHYVSSSEAGMAVPRTGAIQCPPLWVGTYADDEGQVTIASWPAWREVQRPSVGTPATDERSRPTLSVAVTGPDATVLDIAVPVQDVAVVVFRKVLDRSTLRTVARHTGGWPALFSPDGHRGEQTIDLGVNPRELLDQTQQVHPGAAPVYLGSVVTTQGPGDLGVRRWDFEGTPYLILALAVSRRSTRQHTAETAIAILATSAGLLALSLVVGSLTIGRCVDPIIALAERTLARECESRLDERLRERTRIARELHDTLLQSCHGMLYRCQAARNMLPDHPAEAKHVLACVMETAMRAVAEGRDAVQALRTSAAATHDLADALGALGVELVRAHDDTGPAPRVAINVEGRSRALHPIVRHEAYRVAAEALRNAFRHARAQRIDVEIRYGDHECQLLIRDDGRGIDPECLDAVPDGHWGLTGMHERAESIGGTLRIWSAVGAGTEIELTLPSAHVYAASRVERESMV